MRWRVVSMVLGLRLLLKPADFSTGYLEDVLFEFNCKRRRLFLFAEHDQNQDLVDHSMMKCWTSNFMQDCCENFDGMSQITKRDTISEPLMDSQCTPDKENLYIRDPIVSSGANDHKKRSKRALAKVVMCPFALVKPGGFEGNVTLNDINKRILMPPTRAVRHPVGEFAARPLVSPEGPGLSGKAVVAFTKIQTHGRGTITIIRTRN
ncbi:protein XRI1 isoform X2 [Primulina tabacum]|uniref:protein XRI1 isoform X2 n=1 Tax=Primulina tabacum TaxID=48773 RepID=UPI003F5A441A